MPIENLDAYFTIARQHLICEDYALAMPDPVPHLVVCDGCSSSPATDIGARLLAASASKTLRDHFAHKTVAFAQDASEGLPAYTDFGYAVANRARHVNEQLGLPANALDATLLLAVPFRGQVHVYVYGDGYILTCDRRGQVGGIQFTFARNMPFYLSYWLDKARRADYAAAHPDDAGPALTIREFQGGRDTFRYAGYDAAQVFTFDPTAFAALALASDGVGAFMRVDGQQQIPDVEIVSHVFAYKTTKGDFLKRRIRRMLKTYEPDGVYPTDDLSVAAMLF